MKKLFIPLLLSLTGCASPPTVVFGNQAQVSLYYTSPPTRTTQSCAPRAITALPPTPSFPLQQYESISTKDREKRINVLIEYIRVLRIHVAEVKKRFTSGAEASQTERLTK